MYFCDTLPGLLVTFIHRTRVKSGTVIHFDSGLVVTRAPFANFSAKEIFISQNYLFITFIFDRCHHSWGAAKSVKYESGIQYVTSALTFVKNRENNTTETGFSNLTPGLL